MKKKWIAPRTITLGLESTQHCDPPYKCRKCGEGFWFNWMRDIHQAFCRGGCSGGNGGGNGESGGGGSVTPGPDDDVLIS